LASFIVSHREIGHLQAAPAGLTLCEGWVARGADDLSNTGMPKEMRVHGGWLAYRPVMRCP
jgi:hypothetical protein